jgi:hypothetical protein
MLERRIPMPKLSKMVLGIGISDSGFTAQWRSKNDTSIWDVMTTTLGQHNYVKLYVSHILDKMHDLDREERKQWISDVIDSLGDLHNEASNRLGIHSVDIAFHGDLVVAFTESDEATRLVDAGTVEITLKNGMDIAIPTAPVVE